MRMTMHEHEVLTAIHTCHPVKSSYAKLVKATGKARNEIGEIVDGLKAIGYVNVTPANEIYLIKDGKAFLGISDEVKNNTQPTTKDEHQEVADEISQSFTPENEQHPVLASIDAFAETLNKPVLVIEDLDLKGEALAKLAPLLSDDIAELLLEIKSDLERAVA